MTETFKKDIYNIYGSFSSHDDEYPAMGITIQGAPIFVECVRFPDCAVTRRRATDQVQREHPNVGKLWEKKLRQYNGKCRTSTVHIHPMNFPNLSGTDIANFDSLRRNPDDPSTYDDKYPFPVILINLSSASEDSLQILGFWVTDGKAYPVEVKTISDNASLVSQAWNQAKPVPFFSEEAQLTRYVQECVGKKWVINFCVNPQTKVKAFKAVRSDGQKVLVKFDKEHTLGLSIKGTNNLTIRLEKYVDWRRLLDELADNTNRVCCETQRENVA